MKETLYVTARYCSGTAVYWSDTNSRWQIRIDTFCVIDNGDAVQERKTIYRREID